MRNVLKREPNLCDKRIRKKRLSTGSSRADKNRQKMFKESFGESL
jgi:hypothetical protein